MTSMTSGMGLVTCVTLHACGQVVGCKMAFPFPLVVTHLDWVGGLAGATPLDNPNTGKQAWNLLPMHQQGEQDKATHPPLRHLGMSCHVGTGHRPCQTAHSTCDQVSGNAGKSGPTLSTGPEHRR